MKHGNKNIEKLRPVIRTLPDKPGVYQYYDDTGKIIYVGKAKSLRKRVASYFNKDKQHSGKLRVLVSKIAEIRHIVVASELDALLLENNLIKEHQPRYNIQLKDDKTFPWICIKKEPFPRLFSTRYVIRDGSEYFGPYASVKMMNNLLGLIRQLYPLRSCNLNLSKENISKGKYKVCLEFHLGNCLGPCEGRQDEEDYLRTINEIKQIIRGNLTNVAHELKLLMKRYAVEMQYEKAHTVKGKIELLEKYQSKSTIVNPSINNVDVVSLISNEELAHVNYLRVIDGTIVQAHTVEIKKKLEESEEDVLLAAFIDIRQRLHSNATEVIVPLMPEIELSGIKFIVPRRGDKKKLLELSERNAKYYRNEREKQKELVDPERHSKRIMERMKTDLRMKETPEHIECFDNSNIQGDYPVAAMVVFRKAKPSKKEYRHFNIKTVKGPDDFASMKEVVGRRYKRMLAEKQPLPQLIIIDGGKGQLNSGLAALEELGLRGKITIIGIAKRLEELFYPNDDVALHLDKKSETLKIIQQLRDEAHRFGITHHRKKREKGTIKSELTGIAGIGYNTAQQLLWKFKSVKKTRKASMEELVDTIGKARAGIVFRHFHPEDTEDHKEE